MDKYIVDHLGSFPVLWWGSCCSVLVFCVVCVCLSFCCLPLVSFVSNVVSGSGLYILDYPFGFSTVYLLPTVCHVSCVLNVASVSGLAILYCPFGFLWRLVTTNSLSCVLYIQCCSCLWIDYSWLIHWFSLTFNYYQQSVLCLVYLMLPVSLDWPFLIAPLVLSNV